MLVRVRNRLFNLEAVFCMRLVNLDVKSVYFYTLLRRGKHFVRSTLFSIHSGFCFRFNLISCLITHKRTRTYEIYRILNEISCFTYFNLSAGTFFTSEIEWNILYISLWSTPERTMSKRSSQFIFLYMCSAQLHSFLFVFVGMLFSSHSMDLCVILYIFRVEIHNFFYSYIFAFVLFAFSMRYMEFRCINNGLFLIQQSISIILFTLSCDCE